MTQLEASHGGEETFTCTVVEPSVQPFTHSEGCEPQWELERAAGSLVNCLGLMDFCCVFCRFVPGSCKGDDRRAALPDGPADAGAESAEPAWR